MNPEAIKILKDHIDRCPLGWFDDKLIYGRWTSTNEIIDWIKTLKELSDNIKIPTCDCKDAVTFSGHNLNCKEHWIFMNQFWSGPQC